MPQTLLRLIFATLFACQALPASALFALPSECQAQDFNLACEPTEGPHDSEIALLVGNALMHKLIDNDPQLALPLLGSNFLQDWSIAWASFPVPAAIESLISGLDTDRFDELPTEDALKDPKSRLQELLQNKQSIKNNW